MYSRARDALLGQLRSIQPPVAEEDIARESAALDAAIARVESECAEKAVQAEPAIDMDAFSAKLGSPSAAPPKPPSPAASESKPNFAARPPERTFSSLPPAPIPPAPAPAAPMPQTTAAGDSSFASPLGTEADIEQPERNGIEAKARFREPQRPAAPTPPPPPAQRRRAWIVGGVIVALAASIALVNIVLRQTPEQLASSKPTPVPTEGDTPGNGKIAERIGGAKPAAGGQNAGSGSQPSTGASQPAIPVAHRAVLLMEAPEVESKIRTFVGTVIWRFDDVPANASEPLGTAVHADIDVPEAKLRMALDIRKNTDAALPASNTMEIRFTILPGSVVPGIKQISVPQMRREDSPNGEALSGVPVQINDTYFLVGLSQGDLAAHNADLMRNRGWMDFPILLTNGRVAKLTVEKGTSGERMISDALTVWAQQN